MANITGTDSSELIEGTAGDDIISALGGDDSISISLGKDTVDGGTGRNHLYGYTPSLGLPAGARSFTLTADRLFDGWGLIDTHFARIENVQFATEEAGDVTFDASAADIRLMLTVGTGAHLVKGGSGNDEIGVRGGTGTFDGGAGSDRFTLWADFVQNGDTVFVTPTADGAILSQAGRADLITRDMETIVVGALAGPARADASAMTRGVTFYQTLYADTFIGGAGNDSITPIGQSAGAGDSYTGGAGADSFGFGDFGAFAGATITDFAAEDSIGLEYAAGSVKFIGTAAFSGRAGELRYEAANGQTRLIGDRDGDGLGESVLTIANGAFRIVETAPGSKILRMAPTEVRGTEGDDSLAGTPLGETILALGGHDFLETSAGHDVIDGGAGSDQLNLMTGKLALPAGAHNYTISANHLSDASGTLDTSFTAFERLFVYEESSSAVTVNASALNISMQLQLEVAGVHNVLSGSGNDLISAFNSAGSFDGGAGDDSLWLRFDNAANANMLFVADANGVTTLSQAGKGAITARNFEAIDLRASSGPLRVDASGSAGAVRFTSTDSADLLVGGTGSNQFYSGWDATGTGDVFTGGGGADTFSFSSFTALKGATITDFSVADEIDLRAIPGARWIGSAMFSGTAGEIRYDGAGGTSRVIADADGDGIGESLLTLSNRTMQLRETAPGSLMIRAAPSAIDGTENSEMIWGTAGDDAITARGGNDLIYVSRGYDTIDGGAGVDTVEIDAALLELGSGSHSYILTSSRLLDGSGAIDTSLFAVDRFRLTDLTGSNVTLDASGLGNFGIIANLLGGSHHLTGSASADFFSIGGGSGLVDGGAGGDVATFTTDNSSNANPLVLGQTNGTVSLTQAGGPSLQLRNIETIRVGARVAGGLYADASAVSVGIGFNLGASGDIAIGGSGNDLFEALSGTSGDGDVLTGGLGADIFRFSSFAAFAGTTITDLAAEDTLDLLGLSSSTSFIGAAEFTGLAGQYRYVTREGQTQLQGDTDGDGYADSILTIANGAFVLAGTLGSAQQTQLRIVAQLPANADVGNRVTGTAGNDYLDGAGGADEIDGGAGNDIISGGTDSDRLFGGGDDDIIYGGSGDDLIDGNAGTDRIFGESGNDRLFGSGGSGDWLVGGSGNDSINAGGGVYHLFGDGGLADAGYIPNSPTVEGDGDDELTLVSGGSGSRLNGGGGADIIRASGSGWVDVIGGAGDDDVTVEGFSQGSLGLAAGNDVLRFQTGQFAISPGQGIDRMIPMAGASGTVTIYGMTAGEQGDVLDLSVYGEDPFGTGALSTTVAGADLIIHHAASNVFFRIANMRIENLSSYNLGVPNPRYAPQGLTLEGDFGSNPQVTYPDELVGADGDDSISGYAGDDSLFGGGGGDRIEGGLGQDMLDGGWGDDRLLGGDGQDWMLGGEGNDILEGGTGDDTLGGGEGIDTADYAGAGAAVTIDLAYPEEQDTRGAGVDTLTSIENVTGSAFDDVLSGNGGSNLLDGSAGADLLSGGEGHDSLWGGDGDDVLDGSEGDDTLFGGAGIDTVSYANALAGVEIDLSIPEEQLTRGAGVDTLVAIENVTGSGFDDVLAGDGGRNLLLGGAGNDRFVFNDTALAARDTIGDFAAGDLIDLRAIGAAGVEVDEQLFTFIGGAAFDGRAGQVRVSGSDTSWLVEGDIDGNGQADFSIAVTTLTSGGFGSGDFLL